MPAEVNQTQNEVEQFIRLCLQSRWSPVAQRQAAHLAGSGQVDWAEFDSRVHTRRLKPLLYSILRDQNFIPAKTLQAFRTAYDITARYNLYLFSELKRVLLRANDQAIRVLVLKGAALAQTVYAAPGERPLRDVDILVPRDQVPRMENILQGLGYRTDRVEVRSGANLAYECEVLFVKTNPLLSQMEIHWSLIDSPFYQENISTDWFWQTARPLSVGGVPTMMMGAEAQTLYLCAHSFLHHGGDDWLWLHDVAQVIRFYQAEMDWHALMQHAQTLDLVIPLQKILPIVAQDWGAPIPSDMLERIRALPVRPMETRVVQWLTAPNLPRSQRFWHDLVSLPEWSARWSFALSNIFPTHAYMHQRYHISNPRLVPLYYVYRWGRGISHFVSRRL